MKLLQELVHYKSLKIEKNCKEEIIRFISLLCLFQCLHVQQINIIERQLQHVDLILLEQLSFSESSEHGE